MEVKEFFDADTSTMTYCVYHPKTRDAIVVDPVLNYDPVAAKISPHSIQNVLEFTKAQNLRIHAILETHVHADHWTGASILKKHFPDAKTVIGKNIRRVFDEFSYLLEEADRNMNHAFDILVSDSETLKFGSIEVKVLETPGHTPCCLSYVIDRAVFVGDLLFMPDSGTGRCDFPGGDAGQMYKSITHKIYTLDENILVYTGHDYQPGSRPVQWCATVSEHRKSNIRLPSGMSEEEFVRFREERDSQLSLPKLIFSSLQINIKGGEIPSPDSEGRRFLRIPYMEI